MDVMTNTINPLIIQKCKKWFLFAICNSRLALSLGFLVWAMKHNDQAKQTIGILFGGYGLLFSSLGLYAICKEHYYWTKMYGILSSMDTIVSFVLTLAISQYIVINAVIAGLTSYTTFSYAKYLRNGPQNTIPSMIIQTNTNPEEGEEHVTIDATEPEVKFSIE